MSERKAAIFNVSKALLGVSFATIAAMGSASGIGWVAGVTALPSAGLTAADTIGPILAKLKGRQEEVLEIPTPQWWIGDAASWQTTCTGIETRLPSIMNGTAERLKKEQHVPTTLVVRQAFVDEIAHQMPTWEVIPQQRDLVAEYVTTPLLQKVSVVFKMVIDPIREDRMAKLLEEVCDLLKISAETQKPEAMSVSGTPTAVVMPAGTGASHGVATTQSIPSAVDVLLQKQQSSAFDVYICYHEADITEVMKIGEQLVAQGILPWFDVLDTTPGKSLQAQQGEQIKKVKSAAVFVGKYAVADWQALQVDALLIQFVERQCPVIPVLLQDAPTKPEFPVFLATLVWVDFRRKLPDPMARLLWGITGKRIWV